MHEVKVHFETGGYPGFSKALSLPRIPVVGDTIVWAEEAEGLDIEGGEGTRYKVTFVEFIGRTGGVYVVARVIG